MQESELSVLLIEDEPDAARLIQHVLGKGSGIAVTVDWAGDLPAEEWVTREKGSSQNRERR